jgi:hypothetical protein
MAKKTKRRIAFKALSRRTRLVVLPLFAVIAVGAIVIAVITIIVMPRVNQGSQNGVGANGFRAYQEENSTLGIDKVVDKSEVAASLGSKAKSVGDVDISKVFNYDGNRGQTATFEFVRSDGNTSSLYVDVMLFKNVTTMNNANILAGTAKAGTIQGHPVYYMHAQTLSSDREYRLLIANGLKAYRFVVVQPYRNITISEVSALAVLRKLADKANL